MSGKTLLGEKTRYPGAYAPDLLDPIPREQNRRHLGVSAELPFQGEDIWNAYELTWLDVKGKPRVATAEILVPADSPYIVE